MWNQMQKLDDSGKAVMDFFGQPSVNGSTQASCFNSIFNVIRYRVTVERVEESREVVRDRIIHLFNTAEHNHHHWGGFHALGVKFGIVYSDGYGKNRSARAATDEEWAKMKSDIENSRRAMEERETRKREERNAARRKSRKAK